MWQVATTILGILLLIVIVREQIVHNDINFDQYELTQDLKGSTGSALSGNVVANSDISDLIS